jgi:glycine/D-amino acid oxidase-like deaminating enzyme
MHVVIVGAGLTGLCCALSLRARGSDVTLLEADQVGRGTSANSGSAILFQTKDKDALLEWTSGAMALWEAIAKQTGAPYRVHGSLVFFRSNDEESYLGKRSDWLRGRGIPIETLSRAQLDKKMDGLHPSIRGASYCPKDAEANAYDSCRSIAAFLSGQGVSIRTDTNFLTVERAASELVVQTSKGAIRCDALVVAAGPATSTLAKQFGIDLGVVAEKGEQLLTVPVAGRLRGRYLSCRYLQGKAAAAHLAGMAVGQEPDGRIKIGSTRERGKSDLQPTAEGREALLEEVRSYLPEIAAIPIEQHTVGVRCVSPTGLPILQAIAPDERIVFIDGLGGNGVAFGPLVGQKLCGALLGGE